MEAVDYSVDWFWIFIVFVVPFIMYSIPFPTKETWKKNKMLYIVMSIIATLCFIEFFFSIFDGVWTFIEVFILGGWKSIF